jgi:predicted RNA binding protein YcfA (HicA-like mRNA interferase family)
VSLWPATKARRVYAAQLRAGWRLDRTVGSHRILTRAGLADYPFSVHDSEEIGPRMLAKIAKRTGLKPKDL